VIIEQVWQDGMDPDSNMKEWTMNWLAGWLAASSSSWAASSLLKDVGKY